MSSPQPLITSLSNPLIKQARALRQRKARVESGLFLVEGLHPVGQAVEAGWDVETLLYAPEFLTSTFARGLIERLEKPQSGKTQPRLQPVSAEVMKSLADKDNPQGLLAIVAQRHQTLDAMRNGKTFVALVSPQDPGNVGAILRTLDAVGADGLFLLDGGVDLYHPTVVRASMGAMFWKPIVQTSFDEFALWARTRSVQLVGTSAHADVDYHTLVPHEPWALVLGSEQKGLSHGQTAACDVTVSLPMRGRVSSLNLAVAAGVLLYALNA
ncbi:MAG: RNA methyltransferase [Chloroflexi bacterium]|nr:RNA methyltransferase [Chloroflexota bacterium]